MSHLFAPNTLLERVVAHPKVYDQIQALAGFEIIQQRLRPFLFPFTGQKVVLDIGAGTGLYRSLMSETAQYLWLDTDPEKLKGFRSRAKVSDFILMGDATHIGLTNRSVDFALCAGLSHHLSDKQLEALFSELARVVREKLVFHDAIDHPESFVSRVLWRYDRGSYPRSEATLLGAIKARFDIEHIEQYKIYHHYLLCVAKPKQ